MRLNADFRDPRMDELITVGLSPRLIEVARAIGVENFFTLWRLVDGTPLGTPGEQISLKFPRFTRWVRHCRNRLIVSLHRDGLSLCHIRQRVYAELGVDVSIRSVRRVIEKNRNGGVGA
jgi:hypothetical protein